MDINGYVTKETFDGSISLIMSKFNKIESILNLKFQNFETRMNNIESDINNIKSDINKIGSQLTIIINQTKIHRVE